MGKNTKNNERHQKNQKCFALEKIVDRKVRLDGALMYRIRWVGYSENQDTWEPVDHLTNVFHLVQQFERNYNLALKATSKQTKILQNIVKQNKTKPTDKNTLKQDIKFPSTKIDKDAKGIQKVPQKNGLQEIVFQNNTLSGEVKQFYQVEKIVSKKEMFVRRLQTKKTFYRVRWVGYQQNQDTWEPIQNLGLVYHLVQNFNKQQENKKTKKIRKQRDPMILKKEKGKQKCYYEVQKVVDKRINNSETEYRVRWKGYSQCEDTWEPLAHLHRITRLINKFQRQQLQKNNANEDSMIEQQQVNEYQIHELEKVNRSRQEMISVLKQTDNYEIGGIYEDDQSILQELNEMQKSFIENEEVMNEFDLLIPLQLEERQLMLPDFI